MKAKALEVEKIKVKQMPVMPEIEPKKHNLKPMHLPDGDASGFDIDFPGWTGNKLKYDSSTWKSEGYDGVVFIGKGVNRTKILPNTLVDSTVLIHPYAGIVQFEECSVYCAKRKGIHHGLAGRNHPENSLIARNFKVVADEPNNGKPHSTVWGVFTYQTFMDFDGVIFDMEYSAEHASYAHGLAHQGLKWHNVHVVGSGAEGCKVTARPSECRWTENAWIDIQNCTFKNWHQPHSWRGGAGVTIQGTGANVYVNNTMFHGRPGDKYTRCFMVDDSGRNFYSAIDGKPGGGPANGAIIIENSGMTGGGKPSLSPIMRLGTLDPTRPNPLVATKFFMRNSGVYGKNTVAEIKGVMDDNVYINNVNSPEIKSIANGMGINTSEETLLNHKGALTPMSQGYNN